MPQDKRDCTARSGRNQYIKPTNNQSEKNKINDRYIEL